MKKTLRLKKQKKVETDNADKGSTEKFVYIFEEQKEDGMKITIENDKQVKFSLDQDYEFSTKKNQKRLDDEY